MAYVHVNEFAKEFKVTGDWLLQEAEAEFEKGDLVQASEKSWGAVSQYLKALATERDWAHDTHAHLVQVADMLAEETGNEEMRGLIDIAQGLHANYYQANRSEASVRYAMDEVRRYVGMLAAISPPETPPRRNHVKTRLFIQNKGRQSVGGEYNHYQLGEGLILQK